MRNTSRNTSKPASSGATQILIAGAFTTLLSLTGLYFANQSGTDIVRWGGISGNNWEYLVEPGVFLVGLVASIGFFIATWHNGMKISVWLSMCIMAILVGAYFAAQYLQFHQVWQHSLSENETLMGFWEFYDQKGHVYAADTGSLANTPTPGGPGSDADANELSAAVSKYIAHFMDIMGFATGGIVCTVFGGRDRKKSNARIEPSAKVPDSPPQTLRQILSLVAPSFGNANLIEVPDNDTIDLRGNFDGAPIRLSVTKTHDGILLVEMLCPQEYSSYMRVYRNHGKIPKGRDHTDPFSDSDGQRVFLGKGIYIEGNNYLVNEQLTAWAQFSDALQTQILYDMEVLDIGHMLFIGERNSISPNPVLSQIPNVVGYFGACASLLAKIKNAGLAGPQTPLVGTTIPVSGAGRQFTCHYCSSIYFMTASRTHCANCGAPPSA